MWSETSFCKIIPNKHQIIKLKLAKKKLSTKALFKKTDATRYEIVVKAHMSPHYLFAI